MIDCIFLQIKIYAGSNIVDSETMTARVQYLQPIQVRIQSNCSHFMLEIVNRA